MKNISLYIKKESQRLGFSYCGIARAEFLSEDAERLKQWLDKGMHGEMKYMENYFDKRLDPRILVEGTKSIAVFLYNYFTDEKQKDIAAPKISKYAFGKDYHIVIKEKLKELLFNIRENFGDIHGRFFTDSAPVLERSWATRAGLGWVGKNSMLINKQQGSYFFIATMLLDAELEYDAPMEKNYCGTCTACIDACPTDAIVSPQVVDGSKCISYFTIELKENIPEEYKNKMQNNMFGCDICQEVCPWNSFAVKHSETKFNPAEQLLSMTKNEWKELTEEIYNGLFKHSAIDSAGFKKLKNNINFLC